VSVLPGAPNLNLSAEEKRVYGQLFRKADSDNVGVVTGEVAVKFFEKTRLDSSVLGGVSSAQLLDLPVSRYSETVELICTLMTADMANSRQREPGLPHTGRLRHRLAAYWARSSWP